MKEAHLIEDLQQKIAMCDDMAAYRQLYELLHERLFWFSFSLVKSKEVAEEIVSDVFIKIWQHRNQLPAINNLKVYSYTIAKNFSFNYITKSSKFPEVSLDEMQPDIVFSIDNPEELYISMEMGNKIKHAVEELPSQCRMIFQMVREDGLRPKEVAAIMHLSKITVRNQLAIALKKIASAIRPHFSERISKPGRSTSR